MLPELKRKNSHLHRLVSSTLMPSKRASLLTTVTPSGPTTLHAPAPYALIEVSLASISCNSLR
jgi:hypothetical protein